MSKPQVASEPTMEEILSSIRKMISDDKPGPSPLPDVMGRTPFGQTSGKPTSDDLVALVRNEVRNGVSAAAEADKASNGSSFNSLSDALKVATALSDQRKSLQQEIAQVIEKGPRNNLEALTELSAGKGEGARAIAEGQGSPAAKAAAPLADAPDFGSMSPGSEGSTPSDLLSFDFGTMVPQRDGGYRGPAGGESTGDGTGRVGGDAKTEAVSVVPDGKMGSPAKMTDAMAAKADPAASAIRIDSSLARAEPIGEARVLPLRSGLNGIGGHGLNGSVNVSPFPRPARESNKTVEPEPIAKSTEQVEADTPEVVSAQLEEAVSEPVAETPAVKIDPLSLHGEALLDAVVDLVQQQPSALSVFASGDSFIGGVAAKKPSANLPAIAETPVVAVAAEAGAGKMDRAAAELLRPMLRQWLAENMERILEEALRSELTNQVPGVTGPKKT